MQNIQSDTQGNHLEIPKWKKDMYSHDTYSWKALESEVHITACTKHYFVH